MEQKILEIRSSSHFVNNLPIARMMIREKKLFHLYVSDTQKIGANCAAAYKNILRVQKYTVNINGQVYVR